MNERIGKLTFDILLGLFMRSQAIFQIKKYCVDQNLQYELIEDKGLLTSKYHIVLKGTESQLIQAKSDLERWLKQNSQE